MPPLMSPTSTRSMPTSHSAAEVAEKPMRAMMRCPLSVRIRNTKVPTRSTMTPMAENSSTRAQFTIRRDTA